MWHYRGMGKMIQVRNVRPDVHAELTRRAHLRGITLTALIEELLEREVSRPPLEEVLRRIESREPVSIPEGAAELIRAARAERDEQIAGWLDR